MNEQLLSPFDRLKRDYKLYDAKQKAYIKTLENEVSKYKQLYEDIKKEVDNEELSTKELSYKIKYQNVKENMRILQNKYNLLNKSDSIIDLINEDKASLISKNLDLSKQLKDCNAKIKNLRKTNNDLLYKITQYERQN